MDFCPTNSTLTIDWKHGFSPCLSDTVISTTTIIYMVIFGTMQLLFYKKYATPLQHYTLPYSQLFGLQLVLNALPLISTVTKTTISLFVFDNKTTTVELLYLLHSTLVYPLSIILINYERRYMLPTPPSRGHGIILLIFWTFNFSFENLKLLNIQNPLWFFKLQTNEDVIYFVIYVVNYIAIGGSFLIGLKAPGLPSLRHSESFTRLNVEESPWKNVFQKVRMLAPFIWPKGFYLQLCVICSVLLLVVGRVNNVFVPIYSKKIVDSMTTSAESGPLTFRYDYVIIYVALKVIQGGGAGGTGLLNNLRSLLWIRVEQYTTRQVQVTFFSHLHGLSLRWHLQRKTGEVLRAMDRGTDSINNILNYLLFSIFPTIADIIIAIVYFTTFFNYYFGLIVFTTMLLYLIATFSITEWRTKFRRTMNTADNLQRQQAIDSLLNFETVKYYANEEYEKDRYSSSIQKYQDEEWKVTASVALLNFVQLIIINGGLLVGSLLCVSIVVGGGDLTVGDYVMFSVYIMQLYGPLNYFGTYYRMLQKCFIDMENMLDLFKETPEVTDDINAIHLHAETAATIEFRNVSFSYVDNNPVLKNISFKVNPGNSIALVGPSGGGKSTIVRLLFRFYDPTDGEILIGGQNIRKVYQSSLRKKIGVVPQDTVLFNDSIKYNILYGELGSDMESVISAAESARIHEKIMTFPERYDTVVGERGLKLSGGEKQRVAIARTILKNPPIILLDEATSALDTNTERQIQSSLQNLCNDRTSIMVAHRLSTIVNCQQILVIQDGGIVEGGSHEELLSMNGVYAQMWNQQLETIEE